MPSFPRLPAALSAADHGMRHFFNTQQAIARPSINHAPYVTPYLGLRARLSQVWINRWTVLLLLILVRTLLALSSIDDGIGSARREALSACSSVENVGSAMASLPHYMSQGVNELTAHGVEKAVNGLMSMLDLTITGVEEIVVFAINLLTSTYVCLFTMAVGSSLHTVIEAAKDITDFLNKILGEIGDDIQKGADDFQGTVNTIVDGLNSIPQIFGSSKTVPKLDFSGDLNRLKSLSLPSGIQDQLNKLNESIPTFDEVNNLTNAALRLPFEEIKKLINGTMVAYKFDRTVFPIPQKEQLRFCSDDDGINSFFDKLARLVKHARSIFIPVLVILAILVCIPMAYREMYRWKRMQQRAQLITRNSYDPLDVVYISSRPTSSGIGINIANRFQSLRNQTLIRWAFAYATSTPALFVLSLALAGLFSCLCQVIVLRSVQKEVPELTAQVGAFADKVIKSLDGASQRWATETNKVILSTNDAINQEIFGWVNKSSTALNSTLNTFVNEMTNTLNSTFGGTPLYEPITEVLNCLITLKIKGIQKGLTWVSDHAHIDFPLMPNDTFTLGAVSKIASDSDSQAASSFLSSPSSAAADDISEAVLRLTGKLERGIRQEAAISAAILLVWFTVALMGVCRAGYLYFGRDRSRAEGGGRSYAPDPTTDHFSGGGSGGGLGVNGAAPDQTGYLPPYEEMTHRSRGSDAGIASLATPARPARSLEGPITAFPASLSSPSPDGSAPFPAYALAPRPLPRFTAGSAPGPATSGLSTPKKGGQQLHQQYQQQARGASAVEDVTDAGDAAWSEKRGLVGARQVGDSVTRPARNRVSSQANVAVGEKKYRGTDWGDDPFR